MCNLNSKEVFFNLIFSKNEENKILFNFVNKNLENEVVKKFVKLIVENNFEIIFEKNIYRNFAGYYMFTCKFIINNETFEITNKILPNNFTTQKGKEFNNFLNKIGKIND